MLFDFMIIFSVPVFVVVTKIDMSPPNVLQETLKLLVKILKSPGCRKVPVPTIGYIFNAKVSVNVP